MTYCIEVIVPKGWALRPIVGRAYDVFGKSEVKNVYCTETYQLDATKENIRGNFWRDSFVVDGFTEDKLREYALQMKDIDAWDYRAYRLLDCMNVQNEF